MTKRLAKLLALATFCVATATAVGAQNPPAQPGDCWGQGPGAGMGYGMGRGGGWGPGQGRMGQGMMGPGIAMIDADSDGMISVDEAATHGEDMFAMFDLDSDDAVTEEEFMEAAPGPHWNARPWRQGGGGGAYRHRAERFKSFDTDGDGKASRAEFIGSVKAAYDAADADGDGQVTVWEWRAQRRPW